VGDDGEEVEGKEVNVDRGWSVPQRLKPLSQQTNTARLKSCPSRALFLPTVCRVGRQGSRAELPFAFLIEIHQPLAEMNHRKSIKRTELSAIPGVESDSSNSGGYL